MLLPAVRLYKSHYYWQQDGICWWPFKKIKADGIIHKKTTPYHPQSNGRIERFYQTLNSMLHKFSINDGCMNVRGLIAWAIHSWLIVPHTMALMACHFMRLCMVGQVDYHPKTHKKLLLIKLIIYKHYLANGIRLDKRQPLNMTETQLVVKSTVIQLH